MKAAIYCRVSKDTQDVTVQDKICREYCLRNNITISDIYIDNGVSGMKESRPAFDNLIRDMRRMKFDCLVVTKLDRVGRSLQHILSLFNEFNQYGIHFIAVSQSIDTSSAVGKFQLQVLGAFAEFERNIISERTKDGLQFAKNVGKRGKDKKPRLKRGGTRKPLFTFDKSSE